MSEVIHDLRGVRDADLVWLVAPPAHVKSTGMWAELGAALAFGVSVITSGDVSKCIFADLAVKKFVTHGEALAWLETV